jgi:hypothetical protein
LVQKDIEHLGRGNISEAAPIPMTGAETACGDGKETELTGAEEVLGGR